MALDRENQYLPARKIKKYDSNNEFYGEYVMKTEPYHAYWGKITFLPIIEANQTFATIEELNLLITADVLSKLTGIKISVKE